MQHSVSTQHFLKLPLELLHEILDACGLGPTSMKMQKTVEEVLSDAKCLSHIVLVCRTLYYLVSRTPRYWHRIILSDRVHMNPLEAMRSIIRRAGDRTPLHLVVLYSQTRLFGDLTRKLQRLGISHKLWGRLMCLSIRDDRDRSTTEDLQQTMPIRLFRHAAHTHYVRHMRIECNTSSSYPYRHPIVVPSLERFTLASNLHPTTSRAHPSSHFLPFTTHRLTHLEIHVPTDPRKVYDLLTLCQSLTKFRWIAPDKHVNYFEIPRVSLPELTSLHIRHPRLPFLITAPKLTHAIWDVHGFCEDDERREGEDRLCLQDNLEMLTTLTVCRCISRNHMKEILGRSPRLESLTLTPNDTCVAFQLGTLSFILEHAPAPLSLITIPFQTWTPQPAPKGLEFSSIETCFTSRICDMIDANPNVHIVCYLLGDDNRGLARLFQFLLRKHPSQFTFITDIDRSGLCDRLDCGWCPTK